MKDKTTAQKRALLARVAALAALLAALVWAAVDNRAFLADLAADPAARERARDFLARNGLYGVLVFLGLQILQVVLAFVPGGPIQILAGLAYGVWGGLALCLVGVLLSNVLIYAFVVWFKKPFARAGEGVPARYAFLRNPRKAAGLVTVLFLLPGLPKDAMTYAGPFLPLKPQVFILIATFARAPGLILSTLMGDGIFDGQWRQVFAVLAGTCAVTAAGFFVERRIVRRHRRDADRRAEDR